MKYILVSFLLVTSACGLKGNPASEQAITNPDVPVSPPTVSCPAGAAGEIRVEYIAPYINTAYHIQYSADGGPLTVLTLGTTSNNQQLSFRIMACQVTYLRIVTVGVDPITNVFIFRFGSQVMFRASLMDWVLADGGFVTL